MPAAGVTHDITLRDTDGGNLYGLMLSRNSKGRPKGLRGWAVHESTTIQPRTLTMGQLTEAELPAELELTYTQKDWQGGIGGRHWLEDPQTIASAIKIDTTVPGIIQPARELRSTTLSSAPDTYSPSGFAITRSRTELSPTLWAFVGQDVYSGGSDNWTIGTEPQNTPVFYKNGIQFGELTVVPGWYSGSELNASPMPYIYHDAPGSADWVLSTATYPRFKFFAKARNVAGNEVLWGGHHMIDSGLNTNGSLSSGATSITCGADASGKIAVGDIIVVADSNDYANGNIETFLVTAQSGVTLTVLPSYGTTASGHDTGADIYIYQPHVIKSATNVKNGAADWTTAVTIGSVLHPITGLVVDGDTDTLIITKTDGVYTYGAEGYAGFQAQIGRVASVRNLNTQFRQLSDDNNFLGSYFWNGHILLPLGHGGWFDLQLSQGILDTQSDPRHTMPDQTDLHGRVLAFHGDPQNIFALLKDASAQKIHILHGIEVTIGNETKIRWSLVGQMGAGAAITDNRTGLMIDSTATHRRAWMGFTESSVNEVPRFYPFGRTSDDATDGYTDDTDVEAVFVKYDAGLPRIPKRAKTLEIESRNLGTGGRKWEFKYRIDNETTWRSLEVASISPFQTLIFPHGVVYKVLEIQGLPSQTSVGTTNPQVLSIQLRSEVHPSAAKLIPAVFYLADDMQMLNGTIGGMESVKTRKQLNKWNSAARELEMRDVEKIKRTVILMPGSLREREVAHEVGRRPEYEMSCVFAEVG